MQSQIIYFLTVAMVLSFGNIAHANQLRVRTPNVTINQQRDGSIEVNTGQTRMRIPERKYLRPVQSVPQHYYRYRSNCSSQNITQNSVTQGRSGRTVVNTSMSTHQCN